MSFRNKSTLFVPVLVSVITTGRVKFSVAVGPAGKGSGVISLTSVNSWLSS